MRYVLASASPRRREILTNLGYEFTVHTSGAPEDDVFGDIRQTVTELAKRKGEWVAGSEPDALIISADTLVGLDGKRLGKPKDRQAAVNMLKMLSGKTHEVVSGICLINTTNGKMLADADTTLVEFRDLSDEEIISYVETGEPMDKAGSYAIQGGAAGFVKRIEGSYLNIVGFPAEMFKRMLPQII